MVKHVTDPAPVGGVAVALERLQNLLALQLEVGHEVPPAVLLILRPAQERSTALQKEHPCRAFVVWEQEAS